MVYMLLGEGFEETEAIAPLDLLRRADIPVQTVTLENETVFGGHGIGIKADISIDAVSPEDAHMVILPGGLGGVKSCLNCQKALDLLTNAWKNGAYIAAICAGPTVLAKLGITSGKQVTCYPGCEKDMQDAICMPGLPCFADGKLITGTSAGCAIAFGLKLIEALKGKEAAQQIANQIVIR